jgi:hypothetical protein
MSQPIIRFDVSDPVPIANGTAFGHVGPYERILGQVHLAWDPAVVAALPVVDGDRAERGPDGRIHATADIGVLRPVDASRASRTLFYDSGNRGNKRALQYFNDASPAIALTSQTTSETGS